MDGISAKRRVAFSSLASQRSAASILSSAMYSQISSRSWLAAGERVKSVTSSHAASDFSPIEPGTPDHPGYLRHGRVGRGLPRSVRSGAPAVGPRRGYVHGEVVVLLERPLERIRSARGQPLRGQTVQPYLRASRSFSAPLCQQAHSSTGDSLTTIALVAEARAHFGGGDAALPITSEFAPNPSPGRSLPESPRSRRSC